MEAKHQAIPLFETRQGVRHRALELGAVTLLRERHFRRDAAGQAERPRRAPGKVLEASRQLAANWKLACSSDGES
jgi:hypothetical protein